MGSAIAKCGESVILAVRAVRKMKKPTMKRSRGFKRDHGYGVSDVKGRPPETFCK
jgi:hypothetical protein